MSNSVTQHNLHCRPMGYILCGFQNVINGFFSFWNVWLSFTLSFNIPTSGEHWLQHVPLDGWCGQLFICTTLLHSPRRGARPLFLRVLYSERSLQSWQHSGAWENLMHCTIVHITVNYKSSSSLYWKHGQISMNPLGQYNNACHNALWQPNKKSTEV